MISIIELVILTGIAYLVSVLTGITFGWALIYFIAASLALGVIIGLINHAVYTFKPENSHV